LIRELKGEQVHLAESFQGRVEQLEQLVEALRFTDRQSLVDKIDVWKCAYERAAIARDDQEEEYKELVDTKDQQIGAVAEEYREVLHQMDRMGAKADEDLDALDKKWKQEQAGWKKERLKLQQDILKLQTQVEKAEQAKVSMVQVEMHGSGMDSAEHDALKAKVQRQKVKKKALKAGVQELITENTDWRAKCVALEEQIAASAENLEKFTRWRDERYEAMKKEYDAMKAILENEMNTAQNSCKEIEEQVREFPSPFEIELTELKDRYAQTQAGILTMSLDNAKLREDMKAQENMEFISQGSVNNALCFLGPHRKYNDYSRTTFELVPGQGHFGPDAIPGDSRWRRGEAVSQKSAREAMVSLEVAAHSMLAFGTR